MAKEFLRRDQFRAPSSCVIGARRVLRTFLTGAAMTLLPLTFACGLYDRMLALQTGEIKPDGIDLDFLVIDNPREIFDRMSNRLEFDACEMSSSEFVSRHAANKLPFVGLPVFASRVFRHGYIVVNRKFIKSADDFTGKRVGVPLYTQTAAI